MAFPLVAIAASVLPEIIRAVGGDRVGTVADSVSKAVQTVTQTEDPEAAKQKLQEDPALAAELRIRLAEIAVEGERTARDAEEKKRQAELSELEKRLADVAGARQTLANLAMTGSPLAWGAPVISLVVVLGFFLSSVVLIFSGPAENSQARELLNIIVGALVAAFTAVVNFWIGSSQGSRDKDAAARQSQVVQAQNAQAAIQSQVQQGQVAMQSLELIAKETAKRSVAAPTSAQSGPEKNTMSRARAFDRSVAMILEKEGGYVNDPNDPGGRTNHGITARTYADFHEKPLDEVKDEEIKGLSEEDAKEIYRAKYWTAARCDDLPAGVDLCVFDFAVNAGVRTSIKLLQELVHVTADGSVGPITVAAANTCDAKDVIARFADRRLAYYKSLSTFKNFGKGWTSRTLAIRDEALRMAEGA